MSEALVQRAISVCPNTPDAFTTLASIQISRCDPIAARESLSAGLSLWLPAAQAWLNSIACAAEAGAPPSIPHYDMRLSVARLCVELGLYRSALDVLLHCLSEFDESVDVWYLFGWIYYLLGRGDATVLVGEIELQVERPDLPEESNANPSLFWWNESKDCLTKAQLYYDRAQEDMDPPLRAHLQELLTALDQAGVVGAIDDTAVDEQEWEDDDDAMVDE
jgi:tetratricopeptide (TPR) repeat protein